MAANRKSEIGNGTSRGFTLVELLVVIAIIGILVSITIPLVGKVRKSSQESATRALIGQIEAAAQAYYADFSAYPGPFSHTYMTSSVQETHGNEVLKDSTYNNDITNGTAAIGPNGLPADAQRLTGTENLVLGLMGGLAYDATRSRYGFKRDELGLGAMKFNPKRPGRSNSYMQATNLSDGHFADDAGSAKDTEVPEFIDSFSNPLPILYLRARKAGELDPSATIDDKNNNIVVDGFGGGALFGQYNLLEIAGYTQSSIGVGRSPRAGYKSHAGSSPHGLTSVGDPDKSRIGQQSNASAYPFEAYAYLLDPATDDAPTGTTSRTDAQMKKHRVRKQDAIILISAGIDRIYGTEDDLTNFGPVLP